MLRRAVGGSQPDFVITADATGTVATATAYTSGLAGASGDPATVWQACINALKAGTGGLILFKGKHIFTSGITLYPGIAIIGDGPLAAFTPLASTIKSTFNGPTITIQMDATNNRQSFPFLQNFNLIGTPDGTCPLQNLIELNDTPGVLLDLYMDHVMVFWAGLHGMYHNSACKTWITNCYFEDCGRAGVGDGINQPLGFLNVSYSYIHGNQGRGIFSSGASALRLRDSDVNSNIGTGLFVQSTTNDLLVVGNRFTDNGGNAAPQISLRNWNMAALTDAGVVITGNVFQEDRVAGSRTLTHIQTGGSPINARGVISGNTFLGTTFNGKPVVILAATSGKNALVMDGNQGLNDTWGKIANAFATSTVGIEGTAAAPTASTAYTVSCTDLYIVSTAGTGVSISIIDPAGNTLQSGLATFAGTIPVGYAINFGAFSVAPTLSVAVC